MKFCTKCGTKLEAHMAFCASCGTQAGKPPIQQTNPTPVHHTGIHSYAGKNTNYIFIAVVAAAALIGIIIFLNQIGSSELVGTWESSWSLLDREVNSIIVFSPDGSGTFIRYLHFGTPPSRREASFTWETSGGTLVLRYTEQELIKDTRGVVTHIKRGSTINLPLAYEIVGSTLILTNPDGSHRYSINPYSMDMFYFASPLTRR